MGIFAIFMPSGNFNSHQDLVRMNLSDSALFRTAVYTYTIADLPFSAPPGQKSILEGGAAKLDFSSYCRRNLRLGRAFVSGF